MCTSSVVASSIGTNISRAYFYIGRSILTTGNIYTTIQIDDFRIYDNVLLAVTDIALLCGNSHYYKYQTSTSSYVLINSILNSYLPNTTKAVTTGFNTKLGNQDVDLNILYASPMLTVYTGLGFHPRCISGCINYFTADYGVTASSNLVSVWSDQSGNGYDAQATGSYRPTLSNTGLNSLPCILFNGTSPGIMLNCTSI